MATNVDSQVDTEESFSRSRNIVPKLIEDSSILQNDRVDYVFESNNADPRPYLEIKVEGLPVRALLDSGATRTVIGEKGLDILRRAQVKIVPLRNQSVETADATPHMVQGQCKIRITLENRTREMTVLIVPSVASPVILGVDFWDAMHLVADLRNRSWEFSTESQLCSLETKEGIVSTEGLTEDQKTRLKEIVDKYLPEEESGEPQLSRTDLVMHTIDTGDAKPIKQRYYTISPARQKLVNTELDRMLKLNIVEPSKSPWSSPILLVDKPDGSKRFCVNFRAINAVTKPDAYPLPKVTHILDRLRDARFLTSLDIKSAYWQIPLDPNSKEKTAFTVPGRGLFQFLTMPFGLHNAPATWQRFIDSVLGPELEPHVFVYLDDIVIVSSTFENHLKILEEVLQRLKKAKLTLNKEKCKFCRSELRYLGYVVDKKGLRVDPEKVEAILKIPVPKNSKEVRQFVGTASWYRRFIANFATRMHPLTSLLRKGKRFEWTDAAQIAFDDIRSCLIQSPILTCPDFEKPFVIACDASGVGIGAVLSQQSEEGENVVAYASRTLTSTEQKYSATERECLAVIWAIERFRPYVEGTRFTVITDHYSLLWLHNLKDPQGRLARWCLRLQPYDFELIHRKGKEHHVPDMLSRLPQQHSNTITLSPLAAMNNQHRKEDKWYEKMIKQVRENSAKYPLWRVEGEQLLKLVASRKTNLDNVTEWKKVVPKEKRHEVLEECHDKATAGHFGVHKTYQRMQNLYYWPKMRYDVAQYIRNCKICQQVKFDQEKPTGLLGSRRSVDQPWVMLSADLMGPFPRSTRGYKYLLVVTDTFTKFVLLYPLRAATSISVARIIEDEVFMMFGIPQYLICDNGSEFIGPAMKKLTEEYQVKLLLNASRHPQANPTERTNKTIGCMLRAFVGENHRHWDQKLAKIGFAIRTAVHEITGYTPAYLTFGREPLASGKGFSLLKGWNEVPQVSDPTPHGEKIKELKAIYKEVKIKLEKSHEKNVKHYNLRRRPAEFQVGEQVLKKNFTQSNAATFYSAKLAPRFVGPYIISKKVSPVVYQLKEESGRIIGNWHISQLKPYYEPLEQP